MRRILFSLLLAGILAGGGWTLYHKDQIHSPADALQLAAAQFGRMTSAAPAGWSAAGKPTIRVATFNIQVFGPKKNDNQQVLELLAQIVRQFDVVAIQEIRSRDPSLVASFVDRVNATGRQYEYVVSGRLGRTANLEQYAFLFDRETIDLDGSHSYTVEDPDDLMRREPLVGWFRVRGPATDQAFTFTLVNVHLDSTNPESEIAYIGELFRAIRQDGRGEDDVIIAGDFNASDQQLASLNQRFGLTCSISQTPTNTRQSAQYDNLIFSSFATTEFTGRAGVFDFLKEFNLTLEEALRVSDHLPVWAEFSTCEGGDPPRTARHP